MTKTKTAGPKADEAGTEVPEPADDAAPPPEPEESAEPEATEDMDEPEATEEPAEPEASEDVDESEASEEADESEPSEEADESEATETTEKPAPRRLSRDPLIRVASLVTLIAAAAAAWFGWSYHTAAGNDDLAYAAERDRVLAVAEQSIINLNTLDYRDVDAGLKVWQDSTTAQLYNQIAKGGSRLKAEVKNAKTTSTAKILESGLTELDTRAGKAAVIAAVRVTITSPESKPAENIRRLAGQLTRTSSGWKLSALGQAPTRTP